jgi:hypothetical protein
MIEFMARVYRYLIPFLFATGLFWTDGLADQNRLVFPRPDRFVAPIISAAYSDEMARHLYGPIRIDRKEERK